MYKCTFFAPWHDIYVDLPMYVGVYDDSQKVLDLFKHFHQTVLHSANVFIVLSAMNTSRDQIPVIWERSARTLESWN